MLFIVTTPACAGEERLPSPAEIKEFLAQLEKRENQSKAAAISVSRVKEENRDRAARARVPAQN